MAVILLIDDDDILRAAVQEALEQLGHQVIGAGEGKSALDLLQANPADLVITDIVMPGMEGLETIIELRRRHPELKIIAMSGGGRSNPGDYLEVARKLGAAHILAKPFTIEELSAAIAAALKGG